MARYVGSEIEFNGESLTLTEWANHIGIHPATLAQRIRVLGWPLERALTAGPQASQDKSKAIRVPVIGLRCSECEKGILNSESVTFKHFWLNESKEYRIRYTCGFCNQLFKKGE